MKRHLAYGVAGWAILSAGALAQYPCIEGYQVQAPSTQAVIASAMDETGNTALLSGTGGVASFIATTSYDAASETWISSSAAALPVSLDVSNANTNWAPTIDIVSVPGSLLYPTIVTVTGVPQGTVVPPGVVPPRLLQWFYQSSAGPDLLMPGTGLGTATTNFRATTMQTCPVSGGAPVPVPFNLPTNRYGSDAVLMQIAGRVLMHVGDDAYDNTCFPGAQSDGAVWCYELDLATPGGPTPVCFSLIERIPQAGSLFLVGSRYGHSLAASEATNTDAGGGRLAIGVPGTVVSSSSAVGSAQVYEVLTQPGPAGSVTQNFVGSLLGGNPVGGGVMGERVSISSNFAFASDGTGVFLDCKVLERQASGVWAGGPAFPTAVPPAINASASTVIGRQGPSLAARYELVAGVWTPSFGTTAVSSAMVNSRGASGFASPGGDRYVRVDGLGQGRLYASFLSNTQGLVANSRGLIPTITPDGPACRAFGNLELTVEGLPFGTLVGLFRGDTLLPGTAIPPIFFLLGGQRQLLEIANATAAGIRVSPVNLTPAFMPTVGQTVNFQYFYRDGASAQSTNSSEAIGLTVQ